MAKSPVQALYTPEYRRFMKRLKAHRHAAGYTQVTAALALGKAQSYVSRCENGERRVDIVDLLAFAKLYGRKVLDFFPKGV